MRFRRRLCRAIVPGRCAVCDVAKQTPVGTRVKLAQPAQRTRVVESSSSMTRARLCELDTRKHIRRSCRSSRSSSGPVHVRCRDLLGVKREGLEWIDCHLISRSWPICSREEGGWGADTRNCQNTTEKTLMTETFFGSYNISVQGTIAIRCCTREPHGHGTMYPKLQQMTAGLPLLFHHVPKYLRRKSRCYCSCTALLTR